MEFNNKYIPASVRRDRELAFLLLEQKNKTVQEYEKEFTALARHASYLVEGGDRKARKFETGLNPDIQEAIAPLNISDYHEIVDRALNIERTLRFTRAKRAHMSLSRPPVPQWQAGRFPSTSGDRKFLRTDMRSMAYTPRPQTQGFMPRPFITGPRPQPRPGVRPTQYIPPQQQLVQAVSRYCTFCGMTGHTEENMHEKTPDCKVLLQPTSSPSPLQQQQHHHHHFHKVSLSSTLSYSLSIQSISRTATTHFPASKLPSVTCSISQVYSYGTVDYERRPVVKWKAVYKKISMMENPEKGCAGVLNQAENEGKQLTKWELCRTLLLVETQTVRKGTQNEIGQETQLVADLKPFFPPFEIPLLTCASQQ
ncbi:hypothetical protein RJ640_000754 [Escallonia rubra]|uniref:Retrotransposon gag domain-containing protein n=1 Tax=Escallonia rubra TaxID=112253 RepID=A0AA88QFK2_9ASTE|nr:hypothetical protein RJ640_000754 [Escallonia rubra]